PPEIVGNLPYHLTGPLLFRLLAFAHVTGPWTLMVQREVGERLCAAPGSRTYGAATVSIGRVRTVERLFAVPRGAFLPPPRVDSVVLRLSPRAVPLGDVSDPAGFPRFVQRIFQGRRKRLSNALGFAGDRERILSACAAVGVDPAVRCESLSIEAFAALFERLAVEDA
ncbi:MAG: 16S rRNA (adenine(1518)-N(6)/adenine(1519)-N(6))-dimethyltransferase, partial [Deltaproteobacteria bacterium]